MTRSLEALFDAANMALAQNEPRRALALAHEAWASEPENADCCNLVGVCAIAMGDGAAAERCWLHAIKLAPLGAQAHFNLAQYYLDQRNDTDAEQYLRKTVALVPHHGPAWSRLGSLLARHERLVEAEQCYISALEADPADTDSHGNLALLLARQKRPVEAEDQLRQALALRPADAMAHTNLGVLLARLKRYHEAEACYRTAIALQPAQPLAHANLSLLLEATGRLAEAETCARMALALMPETPQIHANLGNLLARMHRTEEAEHAYRSALQLAPNSAIAHSNLGVLLAHEQRDVEAEQHLRHAILLDSGYQVARLNLAQLLLAQGRLHEGWALHEARYHPDLPEPDAPIPSLGISQWQGEPLAGKSLLVWPEQGYGDMIQFCRYLPELKRRGAKRIDLVCRAALVDLLCTLDGVDSVVAIENAAALIHAHEYWTLPMSLPLHCQTELASIPASIPYLHSSRERRAKWAAQLACAPGKLRVGVVLRGNPMHSNDANRSLHDADMLQPLWEVECTQFFSLQIGAACAPDARVIDLGRDIADFADTAAIVDQLDLLISVDTATAHVAGALGKPCWVMLPALRTDWRWMRERADSPWYPGSMRLYRQCRQEDWSAVVARVAADLRMLHGQRT